MLLFRIAFRNLWLHKFKTLIVGVILLLGTALVIVGNGVLDAVDKSMAVSVVNSVSGHLQVHAADAPDKLELFGSFDGTTRDIGMITDFPKVKKALEGIGNIKTVVPMGLNFAVVSTGNVLDRKMSELRTALNAKEEKRTLLLRNHVRRIINILSNELKNLDKLSDMKRIMEEDGAKFEALAKTQQDNFWTEFDAKPYETLEFLENKVAPLALDNDLLWVAYIGTDTEKFEDTFDRFEIVKGERIPPGKRGFMFNHRFFERRVKNKTAYRLDRVLRRLDNKDTIADCDDCKNWIKMNIDQAATLTYEMDDDASLKVAQGLKEFLQVEETDLVALLEELFTMDDTNFRNRYKAFYDIVVPFIVLHRVDVGDTFVLTAFGKGGYTRKVPVKVYGTFRFRSLDRSPLAGGFNLMDMMTFRDLYGFMTQERLAEIETIRESEDIKEINADDAEDALFGDPEALVETAEADTFDDEAALKMDSKDSADYTAQLQDRVYSTKEIENGVVLNAAIMLKDPSKMEETVAEINALSDNKSLNIKPVPWRKSAGLVGEFIGIIRVVLYTAVFIIFVVALIIINNSLVMSTLERTREIGTMRAIGAQRGFIMRMFLVETGALALLFGGLGTLLGTGIMLLMNMKGIPASNDVMFFLFAGPRLRPELSAQHLMVAVSVIAFVAVASTLYPARLATRITPITAMQKED